MPDLFQKFSLSVLQNICDSLASGHSYWDEHCHIVRQTLAALARTCRATHTPAVTALWRDILPHPALLLCTMPADAWQVQQISLFSVPYRVLSFVRPLTDSDFTRLRRYSPLVWRLELQPFECPHHYILDHNSFKMLEDYLQLADLPLLPNLQTYWIKERPIINDDMSHPRFYRTLLSHDLRELRVAHAAYPGEDAAALRLHHANASLALSESYNHFNKLRRVHTGNIYVSWKFLSYLGTLTTMEHISISVGDRVDSADDPSSMQSPGASGLFASRLFHALRKVKITVDSTSLRTLNAFVRSIQSPHVHVLTVRTSSHNAASPCDFQELLRAIGSLPSQEILKYISIDVDFKVDDPRISQLPVPRDLLAMVDPRFRIEPTQALSDDAFIPLYDFKNLDYLYIATSFPVLVTDTTIATMTSKWPGLRRLQLHRLQSPENTSLVTRAGLLSLAHRCKQLVTIGLHIDLDSGCVDDILMKELSMRVVDIYDAEIVILHVGDSSRMANPLSASAFLSHLFPTMEEVLGNWPYYSADDTARMLEALGGHDIVAHILEHTAERRRPWEYAIKHLLPSFTRVREQERSLPVEIATRSG